jgi:hypothetical protein
MPHCPTQTNRTLGALLRRHGEAFVVAQGSQLLVEQRRALTDLARCRTAALGGCLWRCNHCGSERPVYHSCRNRHCPTCQGGERAAWLQRESAWLLPVEYHHVVFTLPAEVAEVALCNRRELYGLLFEAAYETLRAVAANPKHLGAQIGVVAVLHTWGQNLHHHPHLHCVATGGGLACDDAGRIVAPALWRSCRPGFFLPVRVLSRLFRGKYLAGLRRVHDAGRLRLPESAAALAEPAAFADWLAALYRREWVVYAKPPCGGPRQVLKYLARYVHRVAISNDRLLAEENGQVTFTWKDYRREGKRGRLTLPVAEFLRRFVQHVLPHGFVKVRHYGLLANRQREQKLALSRWLLALLGLCLAVCVGVEARPGSAEQRLCPECGQGYPVAAERLVAVALGREQEPRGEDSS